MTDNTDLIKRLRKATAELIKHQFSHTNAAMNALQEVSDAADKAADALEAKQRPMTDEELQVAADAAGFHATMKGLISVVPRGLLVEFARAIETFHGIKP